MSGALPYHCVTAVLHINFVPVKEAILRDIRLLEIVIRLYLPCFCNEVATDVNCKTDGAVCRQ